jgi:hypothetical protein
VPAGVQAFQSHTSSCKWFGMVIQGEVLGEDAQYAEEGLLEQGW